MVRRGVRLGLDKHETRSRSSHLLFCWGACTVRMMLLGTLEGWVIVDVKRCHKHANRMEAGTVESKVVGIQDIITILLTPAPALQVRLLTGRLLVPRNAAATARLC